MSIKNHVPVITTYLDKLIEDELFPFRILTIMFYPWQFWETTFCIYYILYKYFTCDNSFYEWMHAEPGDNVCMRPLLTLINPCNNKWYKALVHNTSLD